MHVVQKESNWYSVTGLDRTRVERHRKGFLEPIYLSSLKALHSAWHVVFKKYLLRASLVAQWLRVCLPMEGTRVRALVWEDPTCRGATGPVSHNY